MAWGDPGGMCALRGRVLAKGCLWGSVACLFDYFDLKGIGQGGKAEVGRRSEPASNSLRLGNGTGER